MYKIYLKPSLASAHTQHNIEGASETCLLHERLHWHSADVLPTSRYSTLERIAAYCSTMCSILDYVWYTRLYL